MIHVVSTHKHNNSYFGSNQIMYQAWIETPDGRTSPKVEGYTKNKALFDLLEFYGEKYGIPIRVVN